MIRAYKGNDLETIMGIANRAWGGIYAKMREDVGDTIFNSLNPHPEISKGLQIKEHVAVHHDWIMICEEQGRVVGFLTYVLNGEAAEIGNNAVDPECGLKGIGQQMYRAALDYFKSAGIKAVKVSTGLDTAHAAARRAYERAGFSVKRESVTYYMELTEQSAG